jgi:hypothetical protein
VRDLKSGRKAYEKELAGWFGKGLQSKSKAQKKCSKVRDT